MPMWKGSGRACEKGFEADPDGWCETLLADPDELVARVRGVEASIRRCSASMACIASA
jgi:hypothetical protein